MTAKAIDPSSQLAPEQCAYIHGDTQCPLHPTIEFDGRWMCRIHNYCDREGRDKQAIEWLNKALRDPIAAQKELQPRDWASEMISDYMIGIRHRTAYKNPKSVGCANRIDVHEITKNLHINQKSHENMRQIRTETCQIDDELGW